MKSAKKILSIIAVLATMGLFAMAADSDEFYNILSLDGGGIRGLITAQVVEYMEDYAYEYTNLTYGLAERPRKKISMSELFDMVSGTSTGSLLTTAIVLPDKVDPSKNMYFADNAS